MITYLADTGLKKKQEEKINTIIRNQALRFQRRTHQSQEDISPVQSDVIYSNSVFNLTSKSQNGFHFISFEYTPVAGSWMLLQLKSLPRYINYFGADAEGNTYYGSLYVTKIGDEYYLVANNAEDSETTFLFNVQWKE